MKKIMFNDRYGLTRAVLTGEKTMTRRLVTMTLHKKMKDGTMKPIIPDDMFIAHDGTAHFKVGRNGYMVPKENQPQYHLDEYVAVAQKYWDLRRDDTFYKALAKADPTFPLECIRGEAGCNNKMFVKAAWMPYHIHITDIKVERLQDISDEDIMREGIMEGDFMNTWDRFYFDEWGDVANHITFKTRREAFASLIDKVSGKGTWERNPWVYVYSFKVYRFNEHYALAY